MIRFPVSRPSLTDLEQGYAAQAIASSWISSQGPFLERFETEWAAITGARYALGTCNGTAALHLALLALDVRPGDEVLVPSLTYVAVANACRYVGATPIFVDVDPVSWCIDPKKLEASVTPRTRGIIAVHSYGHPADMDAINEMAAVHGLWVVEDAAEAHYAFYKGRPVGSLARIGVFSFYGNKILSCGEGGAVTTSDSQLAVRLRTLRGQGVDPARRYYFPVVGYNFRMTNVAAAILCGQLERASDLLRERYRVFSRYERNLDGVVKLRTAASWATPVPWLFCMLSTARDDVAKLLAGQGIETRPFFVPLHTLPPYRECAPRNADMIYTLHLARQGLNLPTYPDLTDEDVDLISDSVRGGVRLLSKGETNERA